MEHWTPAPTAVTIDAGAQPPSIAARLLRDPKVVVAGGLIVLLMFLAVAAPLIAPQDPLAQNLLTATAPPVGFADAEPGYLLGTDGLGRDVLSRVIYGTRVSLTVAFVAAGLACLIGSLLGLLAGFLGGVADAVISRLVEIWMAFPPVLLSILLVAVVGAGVGSVIAAIAIIDWTRFCRVVRAETLNQASADYVTAARAIGFSQMRILVRVVVPLIMPGILVSAILTFINSWGAFLIPLVLDSNPNDTPGAVGIYNFITANGQVQFGPLAAYGILFSLPVIILYIISSRWLSGGFSFAGGIKG